MLMLTNPKMKLSWCVPFSTFESCINLPPVKSVVVMSMSHLYNMYELMVGWPETGHEKNIILSVCDAQMRKWQRRRKAAVMRKTMKTRIANPELAVRATYTNPSSTLVTIATRMMRTLLSSVDALRYV